MAKRSASNSGDTPTPRKTTRKTSRKTIKQKTAPADDQHWPWTKVVGATFGGVIAVGTVLGFGVWISDVLHRSDTTTMEGQLEDLHDDKRELEDELRNVKRERDSAQTELVRSKQQVETLATAAKTSRPVETYLRTIISKRRADWGGKFEQLYAPGTLFMLRERRPHNRLMGEYGQIIRWRLGIDRLPREEKALLSLTGYAFEADPLGGQSPPEYIDAHVESVLFDKDLLTVALDVEDVPRSFRGLLVLGEPASGKTTLLKFLELEAARHALSETDAPIPVRVDLGSMERTDHESILKMIHNAGRRGDDDPNPGLKLPPTRKYLLLIDALDEAEDIHAAAQACIKLADDPRVGRIVATCRIINYDMLLRGKNNPSDPASHSFRTFLLYGQSLAAVEKRMMSKHPGPERQKLLEILSEAKRRTVWLQFFRLPKHFDFATDFLLDATLEDLATPNRTQLLGNYLDNKMRTVEWDGPRPEPRDINALMSQIAAYIFPSRSFADLQVREAVTGGRGSLSEGKKVEIERNIGFARKIGLLEIIPDGYEFRHNQYVEYYTALSSLDWTKVDVSDVQWREVILFRVGRGDEGARQLLQRIIDEGSSFASRSTTDRTAQYVLELAIHCIDASPFANEPGFEDQRKMLEELHNAAP